MDPTTYDYSKLDLPEVLQFIFHPRPESLTASTPAGAVDNGIAVDEGILVHARFHLAGKEEPNILFFHGNGEIVSDYDSIGPYYTKHGMNFLAVDYRGYGKSKGVTTEEGTYLDSEAAWRYLTKSKKINPEKTYPRWNFGKSMKIEDIENKFIHNSIISQHIQIPTS